MRASAVEIESGRADDVLAHFPDAHSEMGSDDGAPPEAPRHRRFVPAFALDRDLVTNREFEAFVEASGYRTDAEEAGSAWGFDGERFGLVEGVTWRSHSGGDRADHPVVQVSWRDAAAYAAWAGKRLPTEAEWERAARAVAGGDEFAWISDPDFSAHCGAGRRWDDGPGTSAVGRFDTRARVRDLVGNVWQWCSDDYSSTAYLDHVEGRPPTGDGELKVRRGGAWNVQQAFRLRCSNRGAYLAERSAPNLGFRCAS